MANKKVSKKKADKLSSRMGDLAEDLGRFLGSSERKAGEWLARQEQLRKKLSTIRDKATALLSQLGPEVEKAKGGGQGKGGKKAKGGKGRTKKKGAKKAAVPGAAAPEIIAAESMSDE